MTHDQLGQVISAACMEHGYDGVVWHVVDWLRRRENEAEAIPLTPAEQAEREVERRDCEALAKLFDI